MADWRELHPDLLTLIADKLSLSKDFIALRGVCSSWHSSFDTQYIKSKFEVPLLLHTTEPGTCCMSFTDISNVTTGQLVLPKATHKMCFSSKGLLIIVADDDSVSLVNPFTGVQIELPHLKTLEKSLSRSYQITRCALSSSPSLTFDNTVDLTSEYIVMIIFHEGLAYCKSGDNSWTKIDTSDSSYEDIAYYKGKFIALSYGFLCGGHLLICDANADNVIVTKMDVDVPYETSNEFLNYTRLEKVCYLVESAEALLLVIREVIKTQIRPYRFHCSTLGFHVVEVDLSTKVWTRVNDLGNKALFVGLRSSSIEVLNVSPHHCNSNCIYFTDCLETQPVDEDMGIYNMEDRRFRYYPCDNSDNGMISAMFVDHMWIEQSVR